MYILTLNPVLIVIRLVVKYIDTYNLVASALHSLGVELMWHQDGTRMLEI